MPLLDSEEELHVSHESPRISKFSSKRSEWLDRLDIKLLLPLSRVSGTLF